MNHAKAISFDHTFDHRRIAKYLLTVIKMIPPFLKPQLTLEQEQLLAAIALLLLPPYLLTSPSPPLLNVYHPSTVYPP
jgi:hypothetical protein